MEGDFDFYAVGFYRLEFGLVEFVLFCTVRGVAAYRLEAALGIAVENIPGLGDFALALAGIVEPIDFDAGDFVLLVPFELKPFGCAFVRPEVQLQGG